ncbi:hypothetical protein [Azonexus sp.]|uniref:hypothetical protein n=1 Tax=Azonexus sp. TaxID=1872668 RepID=UPI00282E675E|nr:hypothetical protein [Azonexus sp.]MDR1996531.1 hypothetical protein [Azonexus sp.]
MGDERKAPRPRVGWPDILQKAQERARYLAEHPSAGTQGGAAGAKKWGLLSMALP